MSESEKCVDGPTLRPSLAEFADPFAYFRSVRPLVEQFGIARIIPPPGWKPPFALDSDSLRLRTTTQRISDLQATDDVSQACFLQGLREFLNAIGQPLTKMPLLGGKDIDLFRLYHAVTDMGGYHQVVTLPPICPVPPPPPPCRGASPPLNKREARRNLALPPPPPLPAIFASLTSSLPSPPPSQVTQEKKWNEVPLAIHA